ncbi:hypothetical protein EAC14_13565 [Enterococcus faecium]|nr:hypothetical protein [Enterococcus faecium]
MDLINHKARFYKEENRWQNPDNSSLKKNVLIGVDTALTYESGILASWMANKFNHNFDEYDRSIDAIYNSTGIGGSSNHHLLDGQHTILGAFQATKDVHIDDSFAREFTEAAEHLLRDSSSVSGINPLFSLTQVQYDKLASLTENLGISRSYLTDALTINGPEILGGTIAFLSSAYLGKNDKQDNLSTLSGSYVVSSLASANPLLFGAAASGLVYSYKNSNNKLTTFKEAGKGSIVSGGALITSSIVGGPAWISMVASICAALSIKYAIENPEKTFQRVIDLKAPVQSIMRRTSIRLREAHPNGI